MTLQQQAEALRQRAEQVIRDVHKELPEAWLGGRQRYVLAEAIYEALQQIQAQERARCAGIAEHRGDNLHKDHVNFYKDGYLGACYDIAQAIREQD